MKKSKIGEAIAMRKSNLRSSNIRNSKLLQRDKAFGRTTFERIAVKE